MIYKIYMIKYIMIYKETYFISGIYSTIYIVWT